MHSSGVFPQVNSLPEVLMCGKVHRTVSVELVVLLEPIKVSAETTGLVPVLQVQLHLREKNIKSI